MDAPKNNNNIITLTPHAGKAKVSSQRSTPSLPGIRGEVKG
jgi:hypothetical protein